MNMSYSILNHVYMFCSISPKTARIPSVCRISGTTGIPRTLLPRLTVWTIQLLTARPVLSSNYKQQKCLIMTAICCCGTCRWEVSKAWQYLTCITSKERLSKLKSLILLYLYKLITSCPCKKVVFYFNMLHNIETVLKWTHECCVI